MYERFILIYQAIRFAVDFDSFQQVFFWCQHNNPSSLLLIVFAHSNKRKVLIQKVYSIFLCFFSLYYSKTGGTMIQRMPYVRRGLNSLYDVSENREIRFSEKCKHDTLKRNVKDGRHYRYV